MDPLAILGDLGEGVDSFLRDSEPVAEADLLADKAAEFRDAVDDSLRHTDLTA